ATASDASRDESGILNRTALVRGIKTELEILWCDLLEKLPRLTDAELAPETVAGQKFREAMVRLWTATRTFEVARIIERAGVENVASRASLLSRVKSQARDYLNGRVTPGPRERWREVQKAFSAWWRPCVSPDGECCILLAMRWELVGQIGQELPGVTDQASL